jgi:hypothetical protein
MSHLSQIIAVEKDIKEKAASKRAYSEAIFGKSGLYSGLSRTYTPKNEEGEQLPPESTSVQIKIKQVLADVQSHMTTLFDTVATKDFANCHAKADIVVDGTVLLSAVPATYILFLEKQLAELLAFVKRIPTLDASEVWHYDANQDCYATEPVETIRSKKVMQRLIAAEATKEHPAQVHLYQEDVPDGRWKTIKFSGAIQQREVNDIVARIERVQMAVKFAREEANRSEVKAQKTGDPLLHYIFG